MSMSKKSFTAAAAALTLTFLPMISLAQTTANNAPLGSKDNPIKPVTISVTPSLTKVSAKGKRGSKTNPITGSSHPRTAN